MDLSQIQEGLPLMFDGIGYDHQMCVDTSEVTEGEETPRPRTFTHANFEYVECVWNLMNSFT